METSEESITNIFATFQKSTENKETEKVIWKQVNILQKQLENSRATDTELCKNLKCIYNSEQFHGASKYLALQRKHQDLIQKITELEDELKKFKIVSKSDEEKLTLQLDRSINEQEEKGKTQVREIQEQIDNGISNHNKKVQQLYSELDLAQITTSLQQDEVETELCKELVDINVKIRQMQTINADIRSEINDIKNRHERTLKERQNPKVVSYITEEGSFQVDKIVTNNRTIAKNYNESINLPDYINANYEESTTMVSQYTEPLQNVQFKNPNLSKKTHASKEASGTKYQPLPVSGIKRSYDQANKSKNIVLKKSENNGTPIDTTLNREINKSRQDHKNRPQNESKKRKLYNPDNLDYLNNIKMSQT